METSEGDEKILSHITWILQLAHPIIEIYS